MHKSHAAQFHGPNPPLKLSPRAVLNQLRFHATNGPAYVQLGATKAIARNLGLYDQTKDLAQRLAEPILGEPETSAKPKKQKLSRILRAQILARGEDPPAEDEEEGSDQDDDPP